MGNETPEIAISELARIILDTVGRDAEIAPMPETAGWPLRHGPDMSKAAKLVSHRAQLDVQEGVRRTYAWYRGNIFVGAQLSAVRTES